MNDAYVTDINRVYREFHVSSPQELFIGVLARPPCMTVLLADYCVSRKESKKEFPVDIS